MSEKIRYKLPNNRGQLAKIISFIPSNWQKMAITGFLFAPRELYEKGKIAKNTRLYISSLYSVQPTIISDYDVPFEEIEKYFETVKINYKKDEQTMGSKIYDVIAGGKLFSCVHFYEAGKNKEEISIDDTKRLAISFIENGYKGEIFAYSECIRNNRSYTPERFHFCQNSDQEPEHLELRWDEEYGGKRKNLEDIIANIEKLGLKKLNGN